MDFEAYLGSNYQLPVLVTGEINHTMSSDILFKDGMLPCNVAASHMVSSIANLSHPNAAASLSTQFNSHDLNYGIPINDPYLEASMASNALIANFHSSTPVQDGCYRANSNVNLSSFSLATNNINVTRSLSLDNVIVQQQLSHAFQCQSEQHKRQHKQLSVPSPLSQSTFQALQTTVPLMDFDESAQVQKKPRLESMKDDLFLRRMIQQLLLNESSRQFMNYDMKIASPSQYQVLNALQRETIPSIPRSAEAHYQQSKTQPPMRNHQMQVPERQVFQMPVIDGATCAARLAQYLQHQRSMPKQNKIAHWKKFIAEYFAVDAKKRWCFSSHDLVGHASFSQAILDSWSCDICKNKSGRGFEVTFEVLPRLCKVNYEGGLVDILLYLDSPRESMLPLGGIMLQYTKVVQETVYKNSRVLHEGQLRVVFTKELKILSWEFCAKLHEEFIPRRLIAPKVNQLIQAANKYEDNIEQNKFNGGLRHQLQATHYRFVKAGEQLAKTLDSHIVKEYGFSKQTVRFFQTAEIVNSMRDLMTYSHENNLGPIESLKRYAQETKSKKMQMYERAVHQNAQAFSSTGNNPMQMISVSTQNPIDESVVLNHGAETDEARNSTEEINYYQRLLMGSVNSNAITSAHNSSQEPNTSVQASRKHEDSCPWNAYQKLLSMNSVSSSTRNNMVKTAPPTCKSATKPVMTTENLSTISFAQGNRAPRKYVLNKLLMEKMFSSGAPQEAHPSTVPLSAPTKGRNEAVSRVAAGSQWKAVTKRAPVRKPRSSSSRAQSSNKGNSTFNSIKMEKDMLEEHDIPNLPGVRVKEEGFHGYQ
ncbi:hypothetical protein V2J09_014694 [Rumex salicifolius]